MEADAYLGLDLGWVGHERYQVMARTSSTVQNDGLFTTTTESSREGSNNRDDGGWQVRGGAWLHPHFGVEFGYVDLGQADVMIDQLTEQRLTVRGGSGTAGVFSTEQTADASIDATAIPMLIRTRYPLWRAVDLEIGLGAVYWMIDERIIVASRRTTNTLFGPPLTVDRSVTGADDERFDVAFDLALMGRLTRSLSVGLKWSRYELGALDQHADFIGIRAEYHFGVGRGDGEEGRLLTTAGATPLATLFEQLWQRERSPVAALRSWEWFFQLGGGWAEHNSAGDSSFEGFSSERTESARSGGAVSVTRVSIISVDEDTAAGRVSAGAWFNEYFGFDIAYVDLGSTASRVTARSIVEQPAFFVTPSISIGGGRAAESAIYSTADINGMAVNGRARYPLRPWLELGTSLGVIGWDSDGREFVRNRLLRPQRRITSEFELRGDNGSGVDITYGVNLKARVREAWWLGVEWTRYEVGADDRDVEFIGATLEYRFGRAPGREADAE